MQSGTSGQTPQTTAARNKETEPRRSKTRLDRDEVVLKCNLNTNIPRRPTQPDRLQQGQCAASGTRLGGPVLVAMKRPRALPCRAKTERGKYSTLQFKQTPWPVVRKRNIPTDQPPLVGEILCQLLRIEGCRVVSAANPPRPLISVF
jgi:hypothetical protein